MMFLVLFFRQHWAAFFVTLALVGMAVCGGKAIYADNLDLRQEREFKLACLEERYFPVQIEQRGVIFCYNKNGKVVRTHG